jgi:membrane fusion protein (multidrug efflux system)
MKTIDMNTNIYSKLSVVVLASLLVACSATTPDQDKKARLEKLKTEQAATAKEIKKLEGEIAKANPEASTVKSKEVIVKELQLSKFDHFVQTQGAIESEENIQISAKMPGVVTQVFVQEGQEVRKGETLAQTDNSLVLRNIEELKASLELAKTVYERQENLWNQKIGTEVQYLQAKNNKEGLEKRLAALYEQNDQTRIKSSINGIVDQVTVKAGQNIMPGAPAVRVVNNSVLKVKANVSEAYVLNIKKGDRILVNVPDLKRDIEAKVTFVGRSIDQLSRTFVVEAKLPPSQDLRANMSVVLKIVYKSVPDAMTVPVNVIQEVNHEKVVYIAQERDGHMVAARKEVVVDGVFDGRAQIQGLGVGDKIITVGYQGLNDGTIIKI